MAPDPPADVSRACSALLEQLNPAQRAAAAHGRDPLLILAGAGTGKTLTLAHRVAYLVAGGTQPGRILLLTFTRRAAAEMLHRVEGLLAGRVPGAGSHIWGGTFHSVAARMLRLHAQVVKLSPTFTIMDRADAEDLMGLLRTELGLHKQDKRFPLKGACLDIYSRAVNTGESLDLLLERTFPWCRDHAPQLRTLFLAYVDRKDRDGVLDYDDLLVYWRGLMQNPVAREVIRGRFDHVLVDEYQDTNALQADILESLCPGGEGLTVVGDDAQSIYSFRAATVRNILDFPKKFPAAGTIVLEENYRSTNPLLRAANRVMEEAAEGFAKSLWTAREGGDAAHLVVCTDEGEQTQYVVEEVLRQREGGTKLREQAVLFRAGHHSLALELELSHRNIPFRKYGGLRFIETAHVKDLIAFLRMADNPRDTLAGTRVFSLLPGFGPTRVAEVTARLAAGNSASASLQSFRPPAQAQAYWPGLLALLDLLRRDPAPDVETQLAEIIRFYSPLLSLVHDNAPARLHDLEQLKVLSAGYRARAELLSDLVLDPPTWAGELAGQPWLDEDYLVLSTIHSAKGLEWDTVFVIHAADGNIPSDMATGSPEEIEEERRLLYVAMTRARNRLHICSPLRYYTPNAPKLDRYGYAQPSRFLTGRVQECMAVHAARSVEPGQETAANPEGARGPDPRDFTRSLWLDGADTSPNGADGAGMEREET